MNSENKIKNYLSIKIEELFGIDFRSLAALRIFIGLLIIFDILYTVSDINAFYTDSGVLPRIANLDIYGPIYFSLLFLSGYPLFVYVFFAITIIFAFLFLIGYRTWLSTFFLFIFIGSIHVRNPLIIGGGDTLLHLMLFWSLFLPLGMKFSVDAVINKSNEKLPNQFLSVASLAIMLQVVFMYCFTASHKVGREWMLEGSAIYYSLNIDQYVTFIGRHLLNYPELLKYLTYFVFYFEAFGPLLLFCPFFTS